MFGSGNDTPRGGLFHNTFAETLQDRLNRNRPFSPAAQPSAVLNTDAESPPTGTTSLQSDVNPPHMQSGVGLVTMLGHALEGLNQIPAFREWVWSISQPATELTSSSDPYLPSGLQTARDDERAGNFSPPRERPSVAPNTMSTHTNASSLSTYARTILSGAQPAPRESASDPRMSLSTIRETNGYKQLLEKTTNPSPSSSTTREAPSVAPNTTATHTNASSLSTYAKTILSGAQPASPNTDPVSAGRGQAATPSVSTPVWKQGSGKPFF